MKEQFTHFAGQEVAGPRVVYTGNSSEMPQVNPELPFLIIADQKNLADLLRKRGFSQEVISQFQLDIAYADTLLDWLVDKATGWSFIGEPDTHLPRFIIKARGLNRSAREVLDGIDKKLGLKKENKLKSVPVDCLQSLMTKLFFADAEEYGQGFFPGNKPRRENYLKAARDGRFPIERARNFMKKRIVKIIQKRNVYEVCEHELNHVVNMPEFRKKATRLSLLLMLSLTTVLSVYSEAMIYAYKIALSKGLNRPLADSLLALFILVPTLASPLAYVKLRGFLSEKEAYAAGQKKGKKSRVG